MKMKPITVDDNYVTFLAKHPDDSHICDDDTSRCWLEWHTYKLDDNNIPVYGERMLFSSNRKPNPKKLCYGQILFMLLILITVFTGLLILTLIQIQFSLYKMSP